MTDCNIIRDLLPLVHDKACSQASRALVEAHVAVCDACRAQLSELEAPAPLPPQVDAFLPPVSRLIQAKRRLMRRAALAVTAVFCALGVFVAGGVALYGEFEKERLVSWSQSLLSGADAGAAGVVRLDLSLARYARATCLFRRLDIDGEERDVAILQFTQSWARKYLDTYVGGPEEVALGLGTGLYIGKGAQKHDVAYGPEYAPEYWNPAWEYGGALSAVYYLDWPPLLNYQHASEEFIQAALEQSGQLIWEN